MIRSDAGGSQKGQARGGADTLPVPPRDQPTAPASDGSRAGDTPRSVRRWPRVRSWMVSGTLVVVAAVVLPVAARHITSSSDIGSERHRLHGTVVLTDHATITYAGDLCVGRGAFASLSSGTTVVIEDTAGTQLAVATLQPGTVTADGTCEFRYGAVVPEVAAYVIVVGDLAPSHPTTIWSMANEPPSGSDGEMADDWWHTLALR